MTVLDGIAAYKRREIAEAKARIPCGNRNATRAPRANRRAAFRAALTATRAAAHTASSPRSKRRVRRKASSAPISIRRLGPRHTSKAARPACPSPDRCAVVSGRARVSLRKRTKARVTADAAQGFHVRALSGGRSARLGRGLHPGHHGRRHRRRSARCCFAAARRGIWTRLSRCMTKQSSRAR